MHLAAVARAGPSPAAQLDAMVAADFDPAIASRKQVTVWYAFWGETRWRREFLDLCTRWSADYQAHGETMVQRVIDAGARFIGPSPHWIATMGHKTRARALAFAPAAIGASDGGLTASLPDNQESTSKQSPR